MLWYGVFLAALAQAAPQRGAAAGRSSLIRFGCSQLVIDRIDPLVNPGLKPSPHLHQIIGGNAFNVSIPESDVSNLATCTTCSYADDLSNYWTANIYFRARNGSYKRVPQIPNKMVEQSVGGVTVYYTSSGAKQTTAFKPGFRMLFGDAMRRKSAGMKSQSCFRCFTGPNFQGDNAAPCMDPRLDTEGFPSTPCPGGIRSNIHFPTCWDGKNLDSPDHQSHVAYPTSGPVTFMGNQQGAQPACPASHPVKIPQLMLEIVWDTSKFADKSQWPTDGSQPLVLSTGDSTGFGQHADYVFGWKDNALQTAMDGGCFGSKCAGLKVQSFTEANKCSVPVQVKEDTDGWLSELPGDGTGA